MTNQPSGDWTDEELKVAVGAYIDGPRDSVLAMRAALNAIGAVRRAPEEPSEEVMQAMLRGWASVPGSRNGMREAYKAANLTLNPPQPKPDDTEYEEVPVVKVEFDKGLYRVVALRDFRKDGYYETVIDGIARFPKPKTCAHCDGTGVKKP